MLNVVAVLQKRVERLRAVLDSSAGQEGGAGKDGGEDDLVEKTEGVLSAALGAHLVLCRIGVLYSWREPFANVSHAMLSNEINRLSDGLKNAWELLRVSGEARRQMLKRLVVVVGQQTLELRQQINEHHHKRLRARFGVAADIRGAAALRETEGKNSAARREPQWLKGERLKDAPIRLPDFS